MPLGCFSLLTNLDIWVMTFAATTYLFVPEYISSVFSSRYSTRPWMSTKFVSGTSFLVSASSKTYVPAPHAKCIESSYCSFLVNASMKLVSGEQDGTGNQPSDVISPLVCSSILLMQSGIVMRYLSLSLLVILPVNETGWKFTAWTVPRYLWPKSIIEPSSWSLTVLITVGTRTTPMLFFLQASSVYGASQWFF